MARFRRKASKIYVEARVTVLRPGRLVECEARGRTFLGYLSGRLCQRNLRVIPDDRVILELDATDLTHGRIVWRLRDSETLESLSASRR